jgi:hypothetical protein
VRKTLLSLSTVCLTVSFLLISAVKAGSHTPSNTTLVKGSSTVSSVSAEAAIEAESNLIYDSLQLEDLGMNRAAMKHAFKGYKKLAAKGLVRNDDILTVVDFSQPSNKKRMYIIDLKNYDVLVNTYVAHGKNSGLNEANRFSNVHESLQSSLGFYVTKGTYFGKHGLSLRLDGKDKGFNDNAEARAIVVHGAEYIGDHRLGAAYMGRSFGCPAVPQHQANKVINLIKDGTTLFIYHPSASYLHGSRILNG